MEKKSINVLSIDGGGIRGILPAEILIYVEEKLKDLYGKDVRLADHFDYIVGTSTGGILTVLYVFPDENGNPKYSAQDASDLYFKNGDKIFQKHFRWYATLGGLISYRYKAKNVEKLFKKYLSNVKIKEAVIPFMVTSVDTDSRDLYLFKSYKALAKEEHNKMFREATRATSAAPTYFKPYRMEVGEKEYSLIDGGMGVNNPAITAYVEVSQLFPLAEEINMLSIGTGPTEESYPYERAKKWGIVLGASKLFDIILTSTSDAVNYQLNEMYRNNNTKGKFLRIHPHLHGAKGQMDKANKKNLKLLRDAGKKCVEEYKDQIDEFLKNTI